MEKTFKKYLESKGLTKQSSERMQGDLLRLLNWCEKENLEPEQAGYRDMIGYVKYLQQRKVKQRTVQIYLGSIKHYYNWLVKRGIREDNPLRNIEIKGIKRKLLYDIIKMNELENLYHRFEIPEQDEKKQNQNWYQLQQLTAKRNKAMLGLMIWQGITTTELQKLTTSELKLREGNIEIPGGKRSNPRTLKLEAHQVLDLMEYNLETRKALLAKSGKETDKLFVTSGKGNNRLTGAISYLIEKLNKLNPRITSTNQIRASVITHWLKLYNLRKTQYMAGHRYVSSTESYLVNDLDDLSEDISKYHPF
ncbi:tyrosine-type recombinase/integrase [Salibacter halophilus]|uniref:Tyrosine-type recombinase/integrase n=2 Tax=Salibacter halophilus TaxID=1803916 RepID=A0A6N6M3C6_9FLAO|nr:tyrosine-type recombinase/integrase [Salibacter halophilus]